MPDENTSMPNLLESAKADKAALAMELRRSMQAQGLDDMIQADNKRYRENHQRIFEANMARFGANGAGPQKGDDMGNINIDSPTTITHPPAPALGTLAKLGLTAALLAGGGGIGAAAMMFLNRDKPAAIQSTATQPTATNTTEGFLIRLVPPK